MKEALHYKQKTNNRVECLLCPHNCIINNNMLGICRARKNINGKLYPITYGKSVTFSIDPIEKKPLYHVLPNSGIVSIGHNSCNLNCTFCQNYEISQLNAKTFNLTPDELLSFCKKENISMVAFTYTEPTTWYEFMLDCCKLLKENNIKTVSITNGFINEKPLRELLPYLDAINIDLKAFTNEFYEKICNGLIEPVKNAIKITSEYCHVEITNLLITDENDSTKEIEDLVGFIAEINPNIPIHFSKYFPRYKMSNQPTSHSSLLNAYEIASKQLNHVYLGNVITETESNTFCPNCNTELIIRNGFNSKITSMKDGCCTNCGTKIYGVW